MGTLSSKAAGVWVHPSSLRCGRMGLSARFLLLSCALFCNHTIWSHLKAQHAAVGHVLGRRTFDHGYLLLHTVQTAAGWALLPGYWFPGV